jgi:hypothetical protein
MSLFTQRLLQSKTQLLLLLHLPIALFLLFSLIFGVTPEPSTSAKQVTLSQQSEQEPSPTPIVSPEIVPANDLSPHRSVNTSSLLIGQGCTSAPTLFYDSGAAGVTFGHPIVDSQGRLIVAGQSCNSSSCQVKVYSFSPNGTVNWVSPGLNNNVAFDQSILLGPSDRIYYLIPNNLIFALDSAGSQVPGWPVELPYAMGNSSPVVIDPIDGTVYARSGISFSSGSFPVAIIAINPNSSQKWRTDYSNGNTGGPGLYQGLGRNLYTWIQYIGLVSLNYTNGNQLCTADLGSVCVGDVNGTYCLANNYDIDSLNAACTPQIIVTAGQRRISLMGLDQNRIFAFDYPSSSATPQRLFASSTTGASLWRNEEIEVPRIKVIKSGILYVLGQHVTDSNKHLRESNAVF